MDLKLVGVEQLLTHGDLGSINNLLSLLIIKNNIGQLFFHLVIDILSVADEVHQLSENSVVIDDFGELREVPRKPFFEPHAKCVNVFVQLLNESNGLNNRFVLPVHISRALLSGERVTETQLGSSQIFFFHLFHDLDEVCPDASLQLSD